MDKTTPIYFICPDNKEPVGGIKQLYRQVDILNDNGFNAYIVHKRKWFRHKWFENKTKIINSRFIFEEIDILLGRKLQTFKSFFKKKVNNLDSNGILVIPEIYGPNIINLLKGTGKVVFNQNCYYTFNNFDLNTFNNNNIYNNPDLLGVIVVSENSKKYLEYTFPKSPIHRIHLGINTSKFIYNKASKKKQIAFMPRKLEDDIIQIINILKIKNNIKNWDFVSINNKSEEEVAKILNESLIFLSLNHKEGFGLPPAEAMASGCIVIGYAGQGGEEYFNPNFSIKIDEGNIIQFVEKVEEITLKYEKNDFGVIKMPQYANDYILNNYNLKKEEESIVSTWKKILKYELEN